MRKIVFLVLLVFTFDLASGTQAQNAGNGDVIISSFDTDGDNWGVSGDPTPIEYNRTDGNPGGSICASDTQKGVGWYYEAPAKFKGDISDAYGGTFTYELKQSHTDRQLVGIPYVALVGSGYTLLYMGASNPGSTWTPFRVDFREDAGWIIEGDQAAPITEALFISVLSNLTTLRIRGEFRDGADSSCLDNVQLTLPSTPPLECPANSPQGQPAINLMDSEPATSSISAQTPIVAYQFIAEKGISPTITMNRISGDLIPYIGLLDDKGNILMRSGESFDPAAASIAGFTTPQDGCYFVYASREDVSNGTTIGAFIIEIVGIQPPVVCPPNMTVGAKITPGETISGTITADEFQICYPFNSNTGGVFTAQAIRTSGDLRPGLQILDRTGNVIIETTANFAGDASNPLQFETVQGETYFIVVQPEGVGAGSGEYTLTLTR